MCEMDQYMDCIVPRGGKGLIETVVSHARMPVIKHYDGICIMYVDAAADLGMAESIILNACPRCRRRPHMRRNRRSFAITRRAGRGGRSAVV
jgi:glutamate-5-semialdehyde dehydrogenase